MSVDVHLLRENRYFHNVAHCDIWEVDHEYFTKYCVYCESPMRIEIYEQSTRIYWECSKRDCGRTFIDSDPILYLRALYLLKTYGRFLRACP